MTGVKTGKLTSLSQTLDLIKNMCDPVNKCNVPTTLQKEHRHTTQTSV